MTLRGRKAGRRRALRIFFATDVHGSDRCFRKFLAAAQVYEADVLLLGGDIAGKGLVPIRAVNGTLHATVHGEAVVGPGRGGGSPSRRYQPAGVLRRAHGRRRSRAASGGP